MNTLSHPPPRLWLITGSELSNVLKIQWGGNVSQRTLVPQRSLLIHASAGPSPGQASVEPRGQRASESDPSLGSLGIFGQRVDGWSRDRDGRVVGGDVAPLAFPTFQMRPLSKRQVSFISSACPDDGDEMATAPAGGQGSFPYVHRIGRAGLKLLLGYCIGCACLKIAHALAHKSPRWSYLSLTRLSLFTI